MPLPGKQHRPWQATRHSSSPVEGWSRRRLHSDIEPPPRHLPAANVVSQLVCGRLRALPKPPPALYSLQRRPGVPRLLRMLGVQVDLIFRAVQPETDRPLSGAAVDVIDEQRLHLMGHDCSIGVADWATILDTPGCARAQPHRYVPPPLSDEAAPGGGASSISCVLTCQSVL